MEWMDKRRNQDIPDFLLNQLVIGCITHCDGEKTCLVRKILISSFKGNLTRKSTKIQMKCKALPQFQKKNHIEKNKIRSNPDCHFIYQEAETLKRKMICSMSQSVDQKLSISQVRLFGSSNPNISPGFLFFIIILSLYAFFCVGAMSATEPVKPTCS